MKKNTSKTFKLTTTLLLFVLLGVQNMKACFGFAPDVCLSYSVSFSCGDDPSALVVDQSLGPSIHYVCYSGAGYAGCNNNGTTIDCTWTDHMIFCDGTTQDTPEDTSVAECTYDPTPCS